MKPKNTLRAYCTCNAQETRVIILLLMLISLFFVAPYLIPNIVKQKTGKHTEHMTALADSNHSGNKFYSSKPIVKRNNKADRQVTFPLHSFDPNTLSVEQWTSFGVQEKTARTICKYVQKGGRFYKPEDLRKIWGLSKEQVDKLIPYVRIQNAEKPKSEINYSKKISTVFIDINGASKEEWESLPGIGPGLAERIMNFREKLGGFVSVDQVSQTYGLPDSTFQKIRSRLNPGTTPLRLLNINRLSTDELSKHPYIRYRTARAIVQYREQHGAYQSIQDLKKIESLTEEIYIRIEPYITTD